jgi:hypothetical protein
MRLGLLTALLFVCALGSAQKKDEIKELFWGTNDAAGKILNIPDKWKNESAVIIYKSEDYHFEKSASVMAYGVTNITFTSSVRKRIKLLDQAAVKEFSEFSFSKGLSTSANFRRRRGGNRVGIKVVKPDGTEKEVNVAEEAVSMDEGKKVAISNLEVGDIIDFYFHSVEPFQVMGTYPFSTEESTIGDEYPIMDMKLSFSTENDFYVNFSTYNGAPELKLTGSKGSRRNYELVASNVEKNDFPRWFYPLAELPCYKFQVYFAKNGKMAERSRGFLPEKETIIKSKVAQQDILAYYEDKIGPTGYIGVIEDYLKGKTFENDEEKVKAVYYFMRHRLNTRFIEAIVANEAKIFYPWDLYEKTSAFMDSDSGFARVFLTFLKKSKIDCEVLVGTPRENGDIEDILLEDNAMLIVKVKTANPIYLQLFNQYTNAGRIPYMLESSNAYSVEYSDKKKATGIQLVKFPATTHKENHTNEKVQVTLADDFSAVNFTRNSDLIGHNKELGQDNKLYFYDFVDEDYAKFDTPPLMELVTNKKKKAQYTTEFDALKNKLRDKQKEEAKKDAENEFEFPIAEHSLSILNTGRYGIDAPFSYKETYVIKDNLIKKAGENYVFEIGKLIGSQTEIKDEELKRTNNIYIPFPRSFDNEIVFDIPQGYTVAGIDKLNKSVENGTGGFVSSAKVEGNKLFIKTHKYYLNYYEPNKNWKDMVAFLDAAYQFTQEKILLKKA